MIQLVFDAAGRPRGARREARPRSATASTRAPSGPSGTTTSSSSWTGRTRSSTPRRARTRTSTTRASSSAARRRRASAATTRHGPTYDLGPDVHTIPSDVDEAGEAFPWIEFEGRWGELQRAFYNGPTGPNLKGQWTEPIAWSEDWRDRAYAVPAGGLFGTGATDFFCDAIATAVVRPPPARRRPPAGPRTYSRLSSRSPPSDSREPPGAPPRRCASPPTRLGPDPGRGGPHVRPAGRALPRDRRRASCPSRWSPAILQALVLGASSVLGIDTDGESGGLLVVLVFAVETALDARRDRARAGRDGAGTRSSWTPAVTSGRSTPTGWRSAAPARCSARS